MSNETQPNPNPHGHGSFERRDIGAAGVIYFFLGLVVVTVVLAFLLVGLFDFLNKRNDAQQAPGNPLVTSVPTDTRHIPQDYEEKAFPDPLLERDEHTKIDDFRLKEEQVLSSYSWADEKSKTVRIPIERAMELTAQRGLPVRPQAIANASDVAAARPASKPRKGNRK